MEESDSYNFVMITLLDILCEIFFNNSKKIIKYARCYGLNCFPFQISMLKS